MKAFKKSRSRIGFEIFNYTFLSILIIVTAFPFLYIIVVSLIDPKDYLAYGITFPKRITLYNYRVLLGGGSKILASFGLTIYLTVVGTAVNILMTSSLAYSLSKKYLPWRNFFTLLIFFTMLFGGGMIPTYLLVKSLGMLDRLTALIIPGAISAWNLFIMRNFFMAIPESLEESAKIDGANDIVVFLKIILPLSLPIIATIGLFYAVGHWNQWFTALLYITTPKKFPLQLVLRDIIQNSSSPIDPSLAHQANGMLPPGDILRMASIVVATLPILFVYPFLQKYFVKGIMIGSVKG